MCQKYQNAPIRDNIALHCRSHDNKSGTKHMSLDNKGNDSHTYICAKENWFQIILANSNEDYPIDRVL